MLIAEAELMIFKSKDNMQMFVERACKLAVLQSKLVKLKIFDQSLSMQTHVNIVTRVCYSYMSKITRIRRFLHK